VVIKPGQFAVLITEENIKVPIDLMAFISIKFSIKFEGLINVSGFHVDPGFEGKLKFSVYNAGSQNVVISSGRPAFQIWFSKIDSTDQTNKYEGVHNGQTIISDKDVMRIQGEIASPNALKRRIDKIEDQFKTLKNIGTSILVALLILIIGFFITGSTTDKISIEDGQIDNLESLLEKQEFN
jgi:dCTP deaminase